MKENIYMQMHDSEVELGTIRAKAKQDWKEAGNKVKDIKNLDCYVKPHENKCYYVINNDFNGSIDLI